MALGADHVAGGSVLAASAVVNVGSTDVAGVAVTAIQAWSGVGGVVSWPPRSTSSAKTAMGVAASAATTRVRIRRRHMRV